ncbi:hypothetical protein NHH03_23260 [Stieleria sp. TO1_6]|uniref:hypothetical protein n=1 Tax=Stieleria tagensis TaxID=2956795 RepID=UPI00209B4BA2|nr:hypothetical protein [Stieleria tagensis]MCO8124677.1 hypothetical protein [Stieleria tagensis]
MTKLKLVFVLAVALVPCAMIGCGGGTETTVIESEPMTPAEEQSYDEQTSSAADDQSQN